MPLSAVLPLWQKLTKAETMAQSPSLAYKLARTTTDSTLEEIAVERPPVSGSPWVLPEAS